MKTGSLKDPVAPPVICYNNSMTNSYKVCQSCGMPFSRDPMGGGTEKDGSVSKMYCSKCYLDGKFTSPEIKTAAQMQVLVKGKLKEMGFPGPVAWLFTLNIPKLERWNGSR